MQLEQPESDLEEAVRELFEAREKLDKASREVAYAQEHLLYIMSLHEAKTYESEDGAHRATVVRNTTYSFDEKGLRKALGARVYNKMTTAKLDRKKLEAAIVAGTLDPVVVAQFATEKQGDPFLRLTEK